MLSGCGGEPAELLDHEGEAVSLGKLLRCPPAAGDDVVRVLGAASALDGGAVLAEGKLCRAEAVLLGEALGLCQHTVMVRVVADRERRRGYWRGWPQLVPGGGVCPGGGYCPGGGAYGPCGGP